MKRWSRVRPYSHCTCLKWSALDLVFLFFSKKMNKTLMQIIIDTNFLWINVMQWQYNNSIVSFIRFSLASSGFGDFAPFCLATKTAKFPFQTMDYSPWPSKNLTDRNRLRKFMQVKVDATCMHTNFGGCGFSGFRDIVTFKNGQISLSDHGL